MTYDEALENSVKAMLKRRGNDGNWREYPTLNELAKDVLVILQELAVIKLGVDDPRDNPPPQSR
jgi:hypothetical protein